MLKIQYWYIFSQMYSTLDKKHKRNLLFSFCFFFLVLENNSGPHPVTKKQYIPTLQTCFWKQYNTSNTTIIFHFPYVMESFHFNIYWQNYFDNLSSMDHDLTNLLVYRSFLIFWFLKRIMKWTYIHTYIYIFPTSLYYKNETKQ